MTTQDPEQDPKTEQMKVHLRRNLESDAHRRGKTVQEMLFIVTVRHGMKEYDIQLDAESDGRVEFDSDLLDAHVKLERYDEEVWRIPLLLLMPGWDLEEEDQSFASGEPLEAAGTSDAGLHLTWQVTLSLDHMQQANEDGPGYNVYAYHHVVTVRKATPEEHQEAIEYVDKLTAEMRKALLGRI